MFFLNIFLLTICALVEAKYQKCRFEVLVVLLTISVIKWVDKKNITELITELIILSTSFTIIYLTSNLIKNKKSPAALSSGDYYLFLAVMLYSGIENGLNIILFGLINALIWAKFTRKYFADSDQQRNTLPLYPFITYSFIITNILIE